MSITLVVNNIPFEYPEQGEQQPWGESATNWASEVTKVLNSLKGGYDLLETSTVINNNQSAAESVQGMFFSPSVVRSFYITGSIYRIIDSTEVSESFKLDGLYRGASQGWVLQQESLGNAGVTFSITPSGQIQYTSTSISGNQITYNGILKFRGIALSQT